MHCLNFAYGSFSFYDLYMNHALCVVHSLLMLGVDAVFLFVYVVGLSLFFVLLPFLTSSETLGMIESFIPV